MAACTVDITSEDFTDFIYRLGSEGWLSAEPDAMPVCSDYAFPGYSIIYLPSEHTLPISLEKYPYYAIPKLFTLLDTSALESSGIFQVFNQPSLGQKGRGTLIGFLDTGIDYRSPVFRKQDGSTRILGIWDQTIPKPLNPRSSDPAVSDSSSAGKEGPFDFLQYGVHFGEEQINEALASPDPLSLVPSKDTLGHGTFLAGVAAGTALPSSDFSGAAPEASLAIVKLKPAKQYLREFFCISKGAHAYQENDIILGIRYLSEVARFYRMPLVVCIGLGTNLGSHGGTSPLSLSLGSITQSIGACTVIAAGNESGLGHHYVGSVPSDSQPDEVEIRVGEGENGFVTELWASTPETYTVGFVSPSGETIGRIPLTLSSNATISFLLEPTVIFVSYRPHELSSGKQLVFMRFLNPSPGIWRIRVYSNLLLDGGDYHMWLPAETFISPNTVFLQPNPSSTITSPGNTPQPITIGAYNHEAGNIFIHSGRGYTIDGRIKPDIAAPGVEVYGPGIVPEAAYRTLASNETNSASPLPEVPMVRKTGTSIAAAITAGAVANLLSWGIVEGNDPSMSEAAIRSYLVRGATRSRAFTYPNKEWGYGNLNLYNTFLQLRE
ncbi:MAG: S8 family peptidase [Lachnospiraceae bacterium]